MMKKILPLLVLVVLLMPMVALGAACGDIASGQPPCSTLGTISNGGLVGQKPDFGAGVTTTSLVDSILGLVNWMAWFVGLAAVVMGLYSGFLFITARDDANQITTARKTMMYAIIGIAVAVISFSLVAISKGIFNLNL